MTRSDFGVTPYAATPTDDMPSDRTFVTEIATGLGMLGDIDPAAVLARRPREISNLTEENWNHLTALWESGTHDADFAAAHLNGRAFLASPDGLNGRRPRNIEWTGARKPPGDEVVPSDLRIDHVYVVSCKYLSRILHNPSPARLVEGLLSQTPVDDSGDWYQRVAPAEYQALYEACAPVVDGPSLPERASDLASTERRRLRLALRSGWPTGASEVYARLCGAVSAAAADAWHGRVTPRNALNILWRLLRIGSAPYFILGASPQGSMRLRIDTPWDWHQAFRLLRLDITAQPGGQPRVGWLAACEVRSTGERRTVRGHVEIRWSHGRFGQPPEAKVYLDSRHEDMPGYHPLTSPLQEVPGQGQTRPDRRLGRSFTSFPPEIMEAEMWPTRSRRIAGSLEWNP